MLIEQLWPRREHGRRAARSGRRLPEGRGQQDHGPVRRVLSRQDRAMTEPDCKLCRDQRWVCEEHPDRPMGHEWLQRCWRPVLALQSSRRAGRTARAAPRLQNRCRPEARQAALAWIGPTQALDCSVRDRAGSFVARIRPSKATLFAALRGTLILPCAGNIPLFGGTQ